MIVLVKDIPAYAFSSGLNELVFATDQNKAVLSLTVGEKEILSETYIPDASGRITINDLQGLIEPYLATNLIERCSYRITDGSSEQNKNFTVHGGLFSVHADGREGYGDRAQGVRASGHD